MAYDYGKPEPTMCRTGRCIISRCCTAGLYEFAHVDGKFYVASNVAGHGWNTPKEGRLEDYLDEGDHIVCG